MARTPTTHDPFNAVAEPKRRKVLETLGMRELSVNDLVELLGWNQPSVSKHLGVLKQVGLVSERRVGRQRLYRVNGERLKPIYDWVAPFEKYWSESFERLDKVLEQLKNNPSVVYIGNDRKISTFVDTQIENQVIPQSVDRVDGESLNNINSNFVDADIAILDTGIDLDHADLNVFHERSFIPGTINADDDHGHGTHLAGVAAAKDNSFGVVGIAPGARLWAIKVLESSGTGEISTLIKGLDYINQKPNQVDVAVLSLGCECESGALDIAIHNSIKAGITIVVAAGNEGKNARTFTPANNPEVITVSAIADTDGKCGGKGLASPYGADDMLASFSNYGDVVDISAPGVDIYSTFKSNSYTKLTGTSMAAPHVAGAAALYKSSHPEASPQDVKNYLVTSGTHLSDLCNGNGHGYFAGDKDSFHEPLLYIGTNKIN